MLRKLFVGLGLVVAAALLAAQANSQPPLPQLPKLPSQGSSSSQPEASPKETLDALFAKLDSPQGISVSEGARRSLQDVVRAAGGSGTSGSNSHSNSGGPSLPNSPGVDAEITKGMKLDNEVKQANTFFQKRRLNRMYREEEAGPKHTQAEYVQWSKQAAPDRLTSKQLDPYYGKIKWPVVLMAAEYQSNRQTVDTLYVSHSAAGGGIDTAEYAEIKRLAKAMQDQLRGNIDKIDSDQYLYTRKFLDGLIYEARVSRGG